MPYEHPNLLTTLQPHQEKVIEKIKNKPGLILYHGLGTGKTLSSIAMANELGQKATVVAPASLIPNYEKELKKHLKDPSKFELLSMQGIARDPDKLKPGETLIVDEAHRVRNPETNIYEALANVPFNKRIFLTGTPVFNSVSDISNLSKLIDKNTTQPLQVVDYFKPDNTEDYPSIKEEVVKVPVDPDQSSILRYLQGDQPEFFKWIKNYPYFDRNFTLSDFFRNISRQVSNQASSFSTEATEKSPKIKQIVKDIENRPGKTLVYSNFLNSGLLPVAHALDQKKIPYEMFTGDTKNRKEIIDRYNSGEVPVLLVSSAGSEGLDLKGTRQVQILEPHWNDKKIQQVIGRAVRYKSHSDLPESDRNVQIKKYVDTFGAKSPYQSADEILYNISQKKEQESMSLEELLKKSNESIYRKPDKLGDSLTGKQTTPMQFGPVNTNRVKMSQLDAAIHQKNLNKAEIWRDTTKADIPNVQFKNPGNKVKQPDKADLQQIKSAAENLIDTGILYKYMTDSVDWNNLVGSWLPTNEYKFNY